MRLIRTAARVAIAALIIATPPTLMACASGKGGRPIRKAQGEVLAHVNGQPIDMISVNRLMKMIQMQGFTPPENTEGATPADKIKNFAIDRLIDREVALDDAYKRGIQADTAQVNQAFAQMKARSGMDSTLTKGLSDKEIRQNLADDLIVNKYFETTVIDSIQVSDAEMQTYFDGNPQQFVAPERVHARHILVMAAESATPEEKATARKKAEGILAEVKKPGADFGAIAREKSEDTGSGANGGDLGMVMRGQTVKPFEDAAFALEPGQISGVVESQFGYHIIKCEEKKPSEQMTLESIKPQLSQMLKQQKVQTSIQARLEALRKVAKIEKKKA